MTILYKERLALKTYVACKTNGIEPNEETKNELEQICKYMKQDFIKTFIKCLGSYDRCSYHTQKGKWYIMFDYHSSHRSLLISRDSLILKSGGTRTNV